MVSVVCLCDWGHEIDCFGGVCSVSKINKRVVFEYAYTIYYSNISLSVVLTS